ncbi:MAG: type II secretion system protein [Sulfurimonas sp.]|uniref:type II secretion system protein n=1 Tax=Sulfurimonas sp. TaxID=2022749 RepID=UPI0026032237|nr:type II secretion system protein [Sulfurimonas sp.]MDD5373730.1 type II secretion system protein [Sulfurimonas sp.]
MVSRKNSLGRFAFTMIELIFAIVIISIAVVSLPMMVQITSKGIENNIVQEAIFAASAELTGATSYYWDKNSMYDSNLSRYSRVIDIGSTCENNTSSPRYRLRQGHIAQPYHRRCLENSTVGAADTNDTTFPNLNNAVHSSAIIFTDTTKNSAGYKEAYTSTVAIAQGFGDANIKKITVLVENSSGDDITMLSTYSANVGEVDYYKRRF